MWYRSTILDTRKSKLNDKEIFEVHIGYRNYDVNGLKVDERDGRRFFGWFTKYDEWKNVVDVTVQRPGTMH